MCTEPLTETQLNQISEAELREATIAVTDTSEMAEAIADRFRPILRARDRQYVELAATITQLEKRLANAHDELGDASPPLCDLECEIDELNRQFDDGDSQIDALMKRIDKGEAESRKRQEAIDELKQRSPAADTERLDWLAAHQHMDDPISYGPHLRVDLRALIDDARTDTDGGNP